MACSEIRERAKRANSKLLTIYFAKLLLQFGNQSVDASRGLNVGRLPRQGPVLDDLDFEFYSLISWGHSRHLPFLR
jgi:hypothetical protein